MSRPGDAVVGMMDAAYFTGRKELLEFFNDLLELKLTKIEQTASGAIACQITELIYPNSIALMKIDWGAKTDYEYVQNYKLLQIAFTKNKIQRHVDVDKLIRAKYQDNLEFCQWLKAFYEQSACPQENYNPTAAREKGKNGKQYNMSMGSRSTSGMPNRSTGGPSRPTRPGVPTRSNPISTTTTTPRAQVSHNRTTTSHNSSSTRPVTKPSSPVVSRPLRERVPGATAITTTPTSSSSAVADAKLIKKNTELQVKNEELETAVIEIEKERDFYFEKLRNVEVLLQIYQEKDATIRDCDHLMDNIFKILYATADDKLTVSEEGEAIPFMETTTQTTAGGGGIDEHGGHYLEESTYQENENTPNHHYNNNNIDHHDDDDDDDALFNEEHDHYNHHDKNRQQQQQSDQNSLTIDESEFADCLP